MKNLNCPNCGAPITGDKCEYCGTVFRIKEQEGAKQDAGNGVKIQPITTEQYDAIDPKDANTLYLLLDEIGEEIFSMNDLRRMAGLPPI